MGDINQEPFNAKVLFSQAVTYPGGVRTPPSGGYFLDVQVSAQKDATQFTPADAETMLIQYLEPVLGLDAAKALVTGDPFVTKVVNAVRLRAEELRRQASAGK